MKSMWIAPKMGARRNIDIVRQFMEYTDVFRNMTLGTAMEQFKMFQENGWFIQNECFMTLFYRAD